MSWESHLVSEEKAVLPAVRKLLRALVGLRHTMGKRAKLQVVNSLIVSKLSYILSVSKIMYPLGSLGNNKETL